MLFGKIYGAESVYPNITMGEQAKEQINESNMNNSEITFDNFTILKEFSNIANSVRNEDFLETVPKAKLRRVKWDPMFDCLKNSIRNDMIQELSSMWQYENMPEKLEVLEKQKEKFAEINPDRQVWRPQHYDMKTQLKAADMVNLQKQKALLDSLAKEYETRVNRLKKTIKDKRGYLRALQMDIHKYQKKNDEFFAKFGGKIENHKNVDLIIPVKTNVDDIRWSIGDLMDEK